MDPQSVQATQPAGPSRSLLLQMALVSVVISAGVVASSVWWLPLIGIAQLFPPNQASQSANVPEMASSTIEAFIALALQNQNIKVTGAVADIDPNGNFLVLSIPSHYEEGKTVYQKIYLDPDTYIGISTGQTEQYDGKAVRASSVYGSSAVGEKDLKVGDNVVVYYKGVPVTQGTGLEAKGVQITIMR